MTDTHRAIEAVRAALDSYEAANTGRDEARAIGSLMTVTDPDNMHLILAAIAAVEAERDALRAALQGLYDASQSQLPSYSQGINAQIAWGDSQRAAKEVARAALAAQPKAESVDAPNEWTMICPDGQRFTGASPLKAASAATRHRIQVDPVAAKHFHDAIASLQRENEAENERLLAEHGTLNCPSCGGSGHIGDVAALVAQPDGRVS